MSVRFDLNGEVLFAGRIEATNFESNPTFIESSRSSAGFHKPYGMVHTSGYDLKFVDPCLAASSYQSSSVYHSIESNPPDGAMQ